MADEPPILNDYAPDNVKQHINLLANSYPEFFESNARAILYSGYIPPDKFNQLVETKVKFNHTKIGALLTEAGLVHRYKRAMGRPKARDIAGHLIGLAAAHYARLAEGNIDAYVFGTQTNSIYWQYEMPALGTGSARYKTVNGLPRANIEKALVSGDANATLYIQRGKLSQLRKQLEKDPSFERANEYIELMLIHMTDRNRLRPELAEIRQTGPYKDVVPRGNKDVFLQQRYAAGIRMRILRVLGRKYAPINN